jgi:nitrogen fixation protein FixH
MLGVMVAGFGIVIAVNFYMASLAVGGFHGTVVENSYVASQKFNGWIDEAEADKALGWEATSERGSDGFVTVTTEGVPGRAVLTAELRRPLGEREYASLTFAAQDDATYRSTAPVKPGRWTMRLTIKAAGSDWTGEAEIR